MPNVTVPPGTCFAAGAGMPAKPLATLFGPPAVVLLEHAASAVTPTAASAATFVPVRANLIIRPPGSNVTNGTGPDAGTVCRPWNSAVEQRRPPPPVVPHPPHALAG